MVCSSTWDFNYRFLCSPPSFLQNLKFSLFLRLKKGVFQLESCHTAVSFCSTRRSQFQQHFLHAIFVRKCFSLLRVWLWTNFHTKICARKTLMKLMAVRFCNVCTAWICKHALSHTHSRTHAFCFYSTHVIRTRPTFIFFHRNHHLSLLAASEDSLPTKQKTA